MGKRDTRLRSPEDFRRALRSKPVVRSGPVALYTVVIDDGFRIGFVLPKKLVKRAVQRNQIKRWSKALFLQVCKSLAADQRAFGLVVRVLEPISLQASTKAGVLGMKADLLAAFSRLRGA